MSIEKSSPHPNVSIFSYIDAMIRLSIPILKLFQACFSGVTLAMALSLDMNTTASLEYLYLSMVRGM
jgi:hypothetical protein